MRRTFWPFLALTVVLLAGCSGDPEPKGPDASGTPTPTATPPPLPEAATQETAEGAATFIDHYLDVLTYSSQTGDTAPLQAISRSDCEGCQDYIERYAERAKAGGWIEGGEFSAGEISAAPYGADTSLQTELRIATGTLAENADSEPVDFNASTEMVTFIATFVNGQWSMAQFVPGEQQ